MTIKQLPFYDGIITIVKINNHEMIFEHNRQQFTIRTPANFKWYKAGEEFRVVKCVIDLDFKSPVFPADVMSSQFRLYEWKKDGNYASNTYGILTYEQALLLD